ncbi:MAG: RNA methyltransferase [Chloroflexi bacterium]|nr:RNA methyltransferase [Chloroflexota bacterium]
MQTYEVRQCIATDCQFRFPVAVNNPAGENCPHCGQSTVLAAKSTSNLGSPTPQTAPRFPNIELLLDNIRSLYNVGAIMRTADGAGVKHLHLGGITAPPTHPKLAKTALGAEHATPWTHHYNGLYAAKELKAAGYEIWALEEAIEAENLFAFDLSAGENQKILLVIGNEKGGVDPDILKLADRTLYLPMVGVKESLNVSVAFGIAIYQIQFG